MKYTYDVPNSNYFKIEDNDVLTELKKKPCKYSYLIPQLGSFDNFYAGPCVLSAIL